MVWVQGIVGNGARPRMDAEPKLIGKKMAAFSVLAAERSLRNEVILQRGVDSSGAARLRLRGTAEAAVATGTS